MRRHILMAATLAALGTMSTTAMAGYTLPDGKTTLGAKFYGDMTYNHTTGNNPGVGNHQVGNSGVGADVKRFYFEVGHNFNDVWSLHLTTDFNYSSTDKNTQVFIKTAYVQAAFSPLATVQLGSANMPWIPYDEGLYGFRYVENTLIDRLGFGHSADWGAHLVGKDGIFSYNLAVVNGGGYHNPTRGKSVDFGGRLSAVPLPGLNLAVGGYVGKLGHNTAGGSSTPHTAKRLDLIAAYVRPAYRLGFEYFKAYDWNTVTSTSSDNGYGLSAWGAVSPMHSITVFARFDYAKPSQNLQPGLTDYYFNVGVQKKVYKGVDLALVFKHEKWENGTAGGGWKTSETPGGFQNLDYNEVGLFTQVKF